MSFKTVYENCLTQNNIKLLVLRENNVDNLLGYRLFCYDVASGNREVYDFAIDYDAILSLPNGETLHQFLKEVTPSLPRLQLVSDNRGGYVTKAELASSMRVKELSGKGILHPLVTVIKAFVLSGRYNLSKCKGI